MNSPNRGKTLHRYYKAQADSGDMTVAPVAECRDLCDKMEEGTCLGFQTFVCLNQLDPASRSECRSACEVLVVAGKDSQVAASKSKKIDGFELHDCGSECGQDIGSLHDPGGKGGPWSCFERCSALLPCKQSATPTAFPTAATHAPSEGSSRGNDADECLAVKLPSCFEHGWWVMHAPVWRVDEESTRIEWALRRGLQPAFNLPGYHDGYYGVQRFMDMPQVRANCSHDEVPGAAEFRDDVLPLLWRPTWPVLTVG